jgi:hypothetical protein
MKYTSYLLTYEDGIVFRNVGIYATDASESPIDGRLGLQLRGYHPVAPRPISYRPIVHCL